MADRYFTLDEAEQTLRGLRPVAERMVALRRGQQAAAAKRAELRERVSGNGGGIGRTEIPELDAELEQLSAALAACVERIGAEGVQVKDLDAGLLDFPALREGREILLCWQVGEPAIAWWHGADEGFAGRKPVDSVE